MNESWKEGKERKKEERERMEEAHFAEEEEFMTRFSRMRVTRYGVM